MPLFPVTPSPLRTTRQVPGLQKQYSAMYMPS